MPAAQAGPASSAGPAGAAAGDPPLAVHELVAGFGSRTVLGANGSGKSTALRCVVGLVAPRSGTIRVAGRDLTALGGEPLRRARREAAMIFQQIHLVRRRSAIDNVCAGALGRLGLRQSLVTGLFPRALREEAMVCLDRVGLADRAAQRASTLSGGQQQRVAIARALCQRPSVLLADEPVASLDPRAAEHVMGLLAELAHTERLAVACVLHAPDLARRHADRVVGVLGGRVAFDAPAADLDADRVAALYADEEPDGR